MRDLIDKISEYLKGNYPNVKFITENKDEMVISPKDDNGFEILIQFGERENVIHFGNCHFHFTNDKEAKKDLLNYLEYGMSRLGRLKIFSKNGKEYKWVFEILKDDDNWIHVGTMGLINFKFWQKMEIKYYQNDLISLS